MALRQALQRMFNKRHRKNGSSRRKLRPRHLLCETLEDRRVLAVAIMLQPDSDSGVSNTDRLTNVVEPMFDVSVSGAGTVGIDVNGDGTLDAWQEVSEAGVYAFQASALADGVHEILAVFTPDESDAEQASVTVTIDTSGPRVDKGVPIEPWNATSRTVSFSEPLDPASASTDSFLLLGPDGVSSVEILAVEVTGGTVTLTTEALSAGGDYTLTVLPTVADQAGNLLNQDGDAENGEWEDDAGIHTFRVIPDAVWLTSPLTIAVGEDTHHGTDLVIDGTTLTITGEHTFNSLWVINGALVTHPAANEAGMTLIVLSDVTIQGGARIGVDGRGYAGGNQARGLGPGGGEGGSWNGGGGGHGGPGGYGSVGRASAHFWGRLVK